MKKTSAHENENDPSSCGGYPKFQESAIIGLIYFKNFLSMKKSLLILPFLALALFVPRVQAGQCFGETIADYYVKVLSAVNVRDAVCEGKVIGTLSQGLVVHAIGDLDGWVQVEYNGIKGFVWGDFVMSISAPGTQTQGKEPLYDVGDHAYKEAIWNLYQAGIVQGNPDGSYLPNERINRAAFAKIGILATVDSVPKSESGCLKDIQAGRWYTDVICYANKTLIQGEPILAGHPDGYFRPADNMRFSEMAKILSLLYGLDVQEGQVWYEGYIQALSQAKAIPPSIKTPDHFVTRAEMAESIDRLRQKDTSRNSTLFNFAGDQTSPTTAINLSACVEARFAPKYDISALQSKALALTNQARVSRGLAPLASSAVLNASSTVWAGNGQFTHTRPEGQTLREYEASLGVTGFSAFGENLGEYSFTCAEADCTAQAITTVEKIHQLFMAEEQLSADQRGHFENITGDYDSLGFGFSEQNGRILLVFQYGKGVQGDSTKLCEAL